MTTTAEVVGRLGEDFLAQAFRRRGSLLAMAAEILDSATAVAQQSGRWAHLRLR